MQESRLFPQYMNRMSSIKKIKLVSDELHLWYAFRFPEIMLSSASIKMNKTQSLMRRQHGGYATKAEKEMDKSMDGYVLHATASRLSG